MNYKKRQKLYQKKVKKTLWLTGTAQPYIVYCAEAGESS